MTDDSKWQLPGEPIHPGPFLGEELEARGITLESFAKQIQRPLGEVLAIVHGSALIDEHLARDIDQALDTGPEVWTNLTTIYLLTLERDYRSGSTAASEAIAAID